MKMVDAFNAFYSSCAVGLLREDTLAALRKVEANPDPGALEARVVLEEKMEREREKENSVFCEKLRIDVESGRAAYRFDCLTFSVFPLRARCLSFSRRDLQICNRQLPHQ